MPRAIEQALKRRAAEHGMQPRTDRYNRYVYGTLAVIDKQKADHDAKREASKVLKGESNGQ